jgi:DNA adenine methylase
MNGVAGSKGGSGVWQRIISEMPPHRVYVEAFGGAGVVYRRKRGCELSLLIEKDPTTASSLATFLPAAAHVIVGDAISLLPVLHLGADALVYADPPYPLSSRRQSRALYRCEMADDEHEALLAVLVGLKCRVMVSTYANPMYARALGDWRCVTIPTVTRGGGGSTELVYCNFAESHHRHDPRWLGRDYRERERIRRRVSRWVRMLASMKPAERAFALSSIENAYPPHRH